MSDFASRKDEVETAVAAPLTRTQRLLRWVGYLLITVSFLMLFYGIIAYAGWRSGESQRLQKIAETQRTEMAHQMELAEADVAAGNFELALRRLDWLLARDGRYPGAAELRTAAVADLAAAQNPTVIPANTPSSTPTALAATPIPFDAAAADAQFASLEALLDSGQYAAAIDAIIKFQTAFPSYRRQETDELLYTAYVTLGRSLLPTDQVESGLSYLEQARRLGNLTEIVEGEITLAELYVEGIVFYEVNWDAYLYYFRQLCAFAPGFHESCERLDEGLAAYGDQLAAALDWCPAEVVYRETLTTSGGLGQGDEALMAKIEQATAACLTATPTPTFPISGTLPFSGTEGTLPVLPEPTADN